VQLGTSKVTCKLYSTNLSLVYVVCAVDNESAVDEMLMNLPKSPANSEKYNNEIGSRVKI